MDVPASDKPFPRRPAGAPESVRSTADLVLGVDGYRFHDLFVPERLKSLHELFVGHLASDDPVAASALAAYAAGTVMTPEKVSETLLLVAPHVGRFVARLFGVEHEVATLAREVHDRAPLFRFKNDFAKKRVFKEGAGKDFPGSPTQAQEVMGAVLVTAGLETLALADEELAIARATLALLEVDEVARKAAKAGGAQWTDDLRRRASTLEHHLADLSFTTDVVGDRGVDVPRADDHLARVVAYALAGVEAHLAFRLREAHDSAHAWPSLHRPKSLDFQHLVQVRRPDPTHPDLFVGPAHHLREREGFRLSDRRMGPRDVEQEIDYCLLCHDRDKDSCSKGLRDPKTKELKKNPLGVTLEGCPLEEKIGEMHAARQKGDVVGALALVCMDNPMCPGTGHRICNDCMKACVFQKQDPVNIPQVETRVLTEVLGLPWGIEIYGFLTRWNPLNVKRPYNLPYNGKNVLVVGLGPAGYTLSHHLTREGFGVVAIDGLKIEPLPANLVGAEGKPLSPVKDFGHLYRELDDRLLLGFGGVSEYGITVRWDKNFLTLLYLTLSRSPLLRIYGGVRFGGTLTLDDAWRLGFDHVAIAAGAGRPTIIEMKNNLSRGIRKASDFLMALQLSGAYKRSSIANLQVRLPAVVIGGGLTAIDTATELLAYYPVQVEKELERYRALVADKGEASVRACFDAEEWEVLEEQLEHAKAIERERLVAAREGRGARILPLLESWGGVTLVYRKSLQDSPAYRLNHEEVQQSLEEGVRYVENASPLEAVVDARNHVRAVRFQKADKTTFELAARTVCVAAGTNPNITYEREYPGSFQLDAKNQYFQVHSALVTESGDLELTKAAPRDGFFTNYRAGRSAVSIYGDNHPHYAGSVVRAMASAKDGYSHVAALFPETKALATAAQPAREEAWRAFSAKMDDELLATVVSVTRLTETIVEVVVRAPLAARQFKPGQFYRLQNFEALADVVEGTRLAMEGLALTGAWIDEEKGLLGTIVLEMGGSSRLCAALRPGEPVVLMGPTGAPTEIHAKENVLLCGGGLGNAVLFSIARAYKALGAKVIYFAGYKRGEDLFRQDDIEAFTDQVVWCTDTGREISPRRPQDRHVRGNIVQAMIAFGKGELGDRALPLSQVHRIIAIGSDRMMAAVKEARHGLLAPLLDPKHLAIGSINSPMQCMMKEICAQCLQKHRDPVSGKETVVFSCYNQDQDLDAVDFDHLRERLRANSMQEKLQKLWLDRLLAHRPELRRV